MPLTNYSISQQTSLDAFERTSNFRSRSFTFINETSGIRVEDAISIDSTGELTFKDANTEVILSDLLNKKNYIIESTNKYDQDVLYFQDEFNNRISLGEIYNNIQKLLNSNLIYWHSARAAKYLNKNSGLDNYIYENIAKTYEFVRLEDDREGGSITVKQVVELNEHRWKNRWIDIPCLAIETPEYINGKYANISAKVQVKTKHSKKGFIGLRILDATTGLELARTVHSSESSFNDEHVSFTIPISYQGPLPDTPIPTNINSQRLTYADIQNLGGTELDFDFLTTPLDVIKKEGLPSTKHIIKLQWITCGLATDILNDGEVLNGNVREFDPSGISSLDVTLFSSNTTDLEVSELNGQINFDETEGNVVKHVFEKRPYGIREDYNVLLSSNKNVNLSLQGKSLSEFVIKTNRKPTGLVVDWCVTYNIFPEINGDELYNKDRELNHYLFTSIENNIDFCDEKVPIEPLLPPRPRDDGGGPPTCECCDCCSGSATVMFTVINGGDCEYCDDIENDPIPCPDRYVGPPPYSEHPYRITTDSYGNTVCGDENISFEYLAEIVESGGNGECFFSFSADGSSSSKVVSENETVDVYQILSSARTIECNAPDIAFKIIEIEPTDPPPPPPPPPPLDINFDVEYDGSFNRLSTVFTQELFYNGLDNESVDILEQQIDKINSLKTLGLEKLKAEQRTNPLELPVQPISDNLLKLDLSRESYESYFENNSSSYLKSSLVNNPNSFINTNEGFLTIKAFRHNVVIFDPRPEISFDVGKSNYFPTFEPIYNKKSLQELLEYIYTAVYPMDYVPPFPNFRVGDYVINGALYNPLYDYRNYRLDGFTRIYNKDGRDEKVFVSALLSTKISNFSVGKIMSYGGKYFQIKKDFNNIAAINTTIIDGEVMKVIPSGILFKEVSQVLFDLNPDLQIVL
jgi:hypothetical protein